MKWMVLSVFALLFTPSSWSNGGPYSSGTAEIDYRNLKTFEKSKEDRRPTSIREKAAKNPRNRSFPGSFEKVDEQEKERMEEKNSNQGIEDLEDDPYYQQGAREE